jgi:hypothetical protein
MLAGSSKSIILKTHTTTTMIVTQQPVNIKSNGIQGAVSFGIKQEGLAHIFNVLRNQLYTNKILAVLREYSCNAVDAHTEAGIPDRPIKVTLPNRMAPELKIRDYGQGLSEQDIQNIYAFYGESTKRQSNALIGQLGLGSKSAFAYGDNFVINSFNDGTKTSYNAFIDASQIGQIAKLFSQPSNEPTGIEIVVPVRMEDIGEFENQAKRVFKYFKVRPEIAGVQIDFEEETHSFTGGTWKIASPNMQKGWSSNRTRDTIAVMGNIGYTIDTFALKLSSDNSNDQVIDSFLRTLSPIIDFQIGDLEISASREGLQYTDRTIKNIKDALLGIIAELKTRFETELDTAESVWKARQLIGDTMDMYHPYNYITKATKTFMWKGKTLNNNVIDFKLFPKGVSDAIKVYRPRSGYVGGNHMIKGAEVNEVSGMMGYSIDSKIVIMENKRGLKGGIVNYAFNFLKDSKKVLVVDTSAGNRAAIMTKLGAVESDIIDMDTLEKLALPRAKGSTRTATGGSSSVQAKQGKSVFVLDTKQAGTYSTTLSDFWAQELVDETRPQDYVWIGIDRFQGVVEGCTPLQPKVLFQHLNALESLHEKLGVAYTAPKVIGVKVSSKATAPEGIKHIKEYIEDTMRSLDAQHNVREFIAKIEFQELFNAENDILMKFFILKYKGTEQYPNTRKLMKLVTSKKDMEKVSYIKDNVLRALGSNGIKRGDVLTHPFTDEFQVNKAKLSMLETTMRILKHVASYELGFYESSKREKVLEAIADLLESRDAKLQDAVAL